MNVFLVEDSAPVRERLVRVIERSGEHAVVGWAEREDDAVRGILELEPDVAIFDVVLTQGSGIRALARVHERLPGLVGIVITNHPTPEHCRASLDAGAARFLDKTFDLPRIAEFLSAVADPS